MYIHDQILTKGGSHLSGQINNLRSKRSQSQLGSKGIGLGYREFFTRAASSTTPVSAMITITLALLAFVMFMASAMEMSGTENEHLLNI